MGRMGFEYDAASLCYFIHHGPNALFISMFLYLVYVNPPILDLTAARNISHSTALPLPSSRRCDIKFDVRLHECI
jgi:hypothetical protein